MRKIYFAAVLLLLSATGASAQMTAFVLSCAGTDDTAQFQAAVTRVGSDRGTISVPYKAAASRCAVGDLTIPPNVTLDTTHGGVKVLNGKTLNLQGDMTGPEGQQRFYNALSGQGTVSFSGNPYVSVVRPEWWGARVNDSVDDTASFRAAFAALETLCAGSVSLALRGAGCGAFQMGHGDYNLGAGVTAGQAVVTITKPLSVLGIRGGTRILLPDTLPTTASTFRVTPATSTGSNAAFGITFRDFYVRTVTFGAHAGGAIILFQSANATSEATRLEISGCGLGPTDQQAIQIINGTGLSPNGGAFLTQIRNNTIYNGVYLQRAGDTTQIENNQITTSSFEAPNTTQGIDIQTAPGVGNIQIKGNSITVCGGLRIRDGVNTIVKDNYFEPPSPACAGSAGYVINLDTDSGFTGAITGTIIEHNYIEAHTTGAALNGIRVAKAGTVGTQISGNTINVDSGKIPINLVSGSTATKVGANVYITAGPSANTYAANTMARGEVGDSLYFAQLSVLLGEGVFGYCPNCNEVSDPCASGPGTGSIAKQLNSRWVCSR